MVHVLWPQSRNTWGAEDAFASIMRRVRVFVVQGNPTGQAWGAPILVMMYPQYRAEVLAVLVPLLTEGLRVACPVYDEDQVVVRVVRDSPIELFVAVGPFRATVREDPGAQGSIWLVLTQFTEQTPREMQMGAGFRPEIRGDAGDLHALLSGLHARLLRLELNV